MNEWDSFTMVEFEYKKLRINVSFCLKGAQI